MGLPGACPVAEVEAGAERLFHRLRDVLGGGAGGGEGDGHGAGDVGGGRGVLLHRLGERLLQSLGDLLAGGTGIGQGLRGGNSMGL